MSIEKKILIIIIMTSVCVCVYTHTSFCMNNTTSCTNANVYGVTRVYYITRVLHVLVILKFIKTLLLFIFQM